jgi:phosphohistidine phosphatase
MAKRLLKREVEIDAFVSSPANRAFSTAIFFAEAYNRKQKHIIQIESLYHAEVNVFYKVIEELDDDFKTVALFSHNPGITEFINSLTTSRIDNMPTCGIFAVKAGIKKWKDFAASDKDFWFFDYPKLV